MIMKVHDSHVLSGPTEDLVDLPKAAEVLLQDLFLVEGGRHISALENRRVGGRRAAQALRALLAHVSFHGRRGTRRDVVFFSLKGDIERDRRKSK